MADFHDRQQAFEAKYAMDEELRFRVAARRDKLFAHWAGEQCHESDKAIADLTHAVIQVPDGPGHDQHLIALISKTLSGHGVTRSDHDLAAQLEACNVEARRQLME